jgi:hypothetical protein
VKGWQPPRVITGLVPVIPIARSAAPFLSGWPGMRIRKKRTPQPKDGVHARLRPGRRDSRRGKTWGHGALAKPCRSARKATDGVRLSRRCSPFRGIAGPGGSLSWGKPSLQSIVRISGSVPRDALFEEGSVDPKGQIHLSRPLVRAGHWLGRTAVHPCLSAPPSASCHPAGTTELKKPMVAPAGRGNQTGWRVNAAGCPRNT